MTAFLLITTLLSLSSARASAQTTVSAPRPVVSEAVSVPAGLAIPLSAPAASLVPLALAPTLPSVPAWASAPALLAAPAAAVPGKTAVVPAKALAIDHLSALKARPETVPGFYDGGGAGRELGGAPSAGEGPELRPSGLMRPSSEGRRAPPDGPPGDGDADVRPRRSNGFLFRTLTALGISLAALAPVLQGQAPASKLLYTLAFAWGAALSLELLWDLSRLIRRVARGPAPLVETRSRARLAAGGLAAAVTAAALGLSLGHIPSRYEGPIVERAARAYAPEVGARPLDAAFAEATLRRMEANAEGREILSRLKDRDGVVRLPAFFSGDTGVPARYVPGLDAVFVSPGALGPEHDAEMAEELFRAVQARRYSAAEDRPVGGGLMEAVYEAALSKHRFIHEKLRADPHAPLLDSDLAGYVAMLGDLKGSLRELDGLERYRGYDHERMHLRGFLLRTDFHWPEHAVEGYHLLAKRAGGSAEARRWLEKARSLADFEGVPDR